MLMVQGNLRVGLLIIPKSSVSIKDLIIEKIETVRKSLIQDFSINKPKIAVLGLNPHCGMVVVKKMMRIKPALKKKYYKRHISLWSFCSRRFWKWSV
jgi:4-hydroxythreonine-4-phosphate dehydrogenase